MSKLAEIKMTQVMSKDYKDIQAIGCCPGWCKSDMAGWERPTKSGRQGAQV